MYHVSCRVFWWNVKSPRWLSPTIPQIWHPSTSGFSQHQNPIWKGRDFRPSMRFRAADGDWKNCVKSQGAYFEGDWGIIVLCTMFLVSCNLFNKGLYFSYYMAGYLLDRPCIYTHILWLQLRKYACKNAHIYSHKDLWLIKMVIGYRRSFFYLRNWNIILSITGFIFESVCL